MATRFSDILSPSQMDFLFGEPSSPATFAVTPTVEGLELTPSDIELLAAQLRADPQEFDFEPPDPPEFGVQSRGSSNSFPTGLLDQSMGGSVPDFGFGAGGGPEGGFAGELGADNLGAISSNSGVSGGSGGGLFGGGTGMSNIAGGMTPLMYAYAIGKGKMLENERLSEDPSDPFGNFGLAMLAPSMAQIWEDPVGMGLPTLLGAPFLTPFTGSDEAKQTEPEWAGLFGGLF